MKKLRIQLIVLLLLLLAGVSSTKLVNVYCEPSIEQQEQMFRLEENHLNIKDLNYLNEVGREFVRERTYIVYYAYQGNQICREEIMKNIYARFLNRGWSYAGGFKMNDGSLEKEFNKERCFCIVIVKDKSVVLKFRYKAKIYNEVAHLKV